MREYNFKKGNKFGKGRPKGSSYIEIARQWVVQKGWKKLIDTAMGKDFEVKTENGRVIEVGTSRELQFEALKLLFAYGIGKPTEKHEISGADGGPIIVQSVTFESFCKDKPAA